MNIKTTYVKRVIYAVLGILLVASCSKDQPIADDILPEEEEEDLQEEILPPQFQVTTAKTTYQAGEKVNFIIEGDAKVLDFWSGEFGHDYDYRNGRIVSPKEIELSFEMRLQYPEREGGVISVLVSTGFEGNRESVQDIQGAAWTDITDKCEIDYESGNWASSGKVKLTELREEGKPMHIAFRYEYDPIERARNGYVAWIRNILVEKETEEGKVQLSASPFSNDYLAYTTTSQYKLPTRSDNRETSLVMQPNSGTSTEYPVGSGVFYGNQDYTDEYFVSVPYDVSGKDLGADEPTRKLGTQITSHEHEFSEPGVYKVRFVGTNLLLEDNNQTIRELEITITE